MVPVAPIFLQVFIALIRIGIPICAVVSSPAFATDWDKRNEEYGKTIQPLVKQFCWKCHTGAEAESGLALNKIGRAHV